MQIFSAPIILAPFSIFIIMEEESLWNCNVQSLLLWNKIAPLNRSSTLSFWLFFRILFPHWKNRFKFRVESFLFAQSSLFYISSYSSSGCRQVPKKKESLVPSWNLDHHRSLWWDFEFGTESPSSDFRDSMRGNAVPYFTKVIRSSVAA